MNLSRALIWSAITGAVIPVVLHSIWQMNNSINFFDTSASIILQKTTLILWPSSFFMLATTGDALYPLSALTNVALYTALGAGIYYGLARHRLILIIPILMISLIEWRLLSLK
ncbi:hypothetical protein [Pseudomonas fluorescens]|uniref:hypothetical protein n=1 Tax=Pseudomonas fluorescens TaxID=294 RepID=UPI003D04EE07